MLCSPPQCQTVWKHRDGTQDLSKGLLVGGKLEGWHPVNIELVQFSHPDFPNGTWSVYCPAADCGARPSFSKQGTNQAVLKHHHHLPCTVCRTLMEREKGSIRRPYLPCRVCMAKPLLLPAKAVLAARFAPLSLCTHLALHHSRYASYLPLHSSRFATRSL